MAIVAGSRVTTKQTSADFPAVNQGAMSLTQPPAFGVCSTVSAPNCAIMWDNGTYVAAVATAVIDDLFDADATTIAALFGRVVRRNVSPEASNESSEFYGVVVAMYRRNSDSAASEYALIRSAAGVYREILTSQLEVVSGL